MIEVMLFAGAAGGLGMAVVCGLQVEAVRRWRSELAAYRLRFPLGVEPAAVTTWRASRFPDSGPNRVWSGMEDGQCRNGVGSFLLSFGMKRSRW